MRKLLAINSILLLICATAWLVPFYYICTYGTHTVYEPSAFILGLEVAVFILILATALFSMIYVCIKKPSRGTSSAD